jgi:hypothetical protein
MLHSPHSFAKVEEVERLEENLRKLKTHSPPLLKVLNN